MVLRKLFIIGLLAMGGWMASSCASGGGNHSCGNGVCEDFEDSVSCSVDCAGNTCGNFICDIGENETTCAADCSGGICGNAICEASENTLTCAVDCVCGNNTCDTGESAATCPIDCGTTTCGNGICDATETTTTCPQDCTTNPVCGDGICNGTETTTTCPQDCATSCTDPVCDLYPQCGCTSGEKCTLDAGDNDCVPAGSTQAGGICTAESDCVVGAGCFARDNALTQGQCLAYCNPTTQAGCTGTTSYCVKLMDSGSVPIPGAGICTITCQAHNPSASCPAGYNCDLYTYPSTQVNFSDCHADVGPGTHGSTCDMTNGPYCAVGYGCFDDGTSTSCYQWCTPGSSCAGSRSCETTAFDPLFIVGGTTYGICL